MPIAFNEAGVFSGAQGGPNILNNPTSLQFGPDGRLYVSEQNGSINAFTVELQDGEYVATAAEQLVDGNGDELVKSIQNHNDDGSEADGATNRQVTGIVVAGTSEAPILFISSSDPRISTNQDSGLDTNSGIVTQATFNSATNEWDVVDLVRGLPRSEENHSVNGMLLSEDGTKLLLNVGGFTNNGAPSSFFSYTNEYALSGSVLELDLVALNQLPDQIDPEGGQGNTPRTFKYDLPTLDDPNRENAPEGLSDADAIAQGFLEDSGGMDLTGPFGGNDGFNMAILPADAPLRLYAEGTRNDYDLARGQNGIIYTVDNGSNGGLGAEPNTETGDEDGDGVSGEALGTPNNGGQGEGEPFHTVVEGGYYYHPNPVRSNQNMAWTAYDDDGDPDTSLDVPTVLDISELVPDAVNIADGFLIDPSKFAVAPGVTLADLSPEEQEERLLLSGEFINSNQLDNIADPDGDGSGQTTIAQLGSSTNGIIVYDSGGAAFGGTIDGKVFVTQFNDNITLLNVNDAGTDLEPIFEEGPDGIFGTADDVVQDADGILQVANNGTGVPLGNPLDLTQGPNGTIWVAEIGSNEITVLAPTVVLDPTNEDADFDGILNKDDPFSRDATNGTSVTITAAEATVWEFSQGAGDTTPGPDGFGGGLTGAMINGVTDYEAFYLEEDPENAPDLRLDNVKFVTAALGGTTTVEQVSNGDPFTDQNDGEYLFHTGFVLDQAVETFTVSWVTGNPGALAGGSDITSAFQQLGGYVGDGTQSNYIKIVAIQTNSGPKIQVTLEEAVSLGGFPEEFEDQIIQTFNLDAPGIFDNGSLVPDSTITLDLLFDLTAKTATPTATYESTSGPVTITGGPNDVIDLSPGGQDSVVLQTILGNTSLPGGEEQGIAAGLFSSNTQSDSDSFQAVFDSITVTATEAAVAPVAGDDTFNTQVGDPVTIPVAQLLANDTDANAGDVLTVTGVSNPSNGTVDLVDGVVTFTPDAGFEGDATFDYTVSDGNGGSDTGSVTVQVSDLTVLFRINAAGATVAALPDDPFGSDLEWLGLGTGNGTAPSGTQSGFDFSVTSTNTSVQDVANRDASVPDYVPQELFAVERWDPPAGSDMQWTFGTGDLANGTYTVNIYASNGFGGTSEPGQRVFDVTIEDELAFDNVDLSEQFGHQVGGLLSYEVEVTDGTLNIELGRDGTDSIENPTINAIEILAGAVEPQLPSIDIISGDQTVSEDDGQVFISVVTSETVPIGESVSFTYVIEGVSATPEIDYSPDESLSGSGTATFTGNATIAGGSSDFQIPIDILQDAEIETDETFTVTIVSVSPTHQIGNGVATVTIEDDDTATGPGEVLFRINAGGPEVASIDDGPAWSADLGSVANGSAVAGDASPFLVDRGIDGTTNATSDNTTFGDATPNGPGENDTGAPDALFTTERFSSQANPNNIGYAFDVDNGDYVVNLYFDELFFTAAGARVFDIVLEDILVADDFDTFVAAGNSNDTTLQSFDVTVTDGQLNIELLKTAVNNPHIAAIEILSAGGDVYTPPLDDLFGTAVEISNNGFAPTDAGLLSTGDNVVSATQEGEFDGNNGVRDRDYFTVEIPQGQILTGIFLDDYDVSANPDTAPDGFLAFAEGTTIATNPVTGENLDALTGAIIYGTGDIGSNLLDTMRAGFDNPAGGQTLPSFDQALTGNLTFWLNQGAGPNTPTLRFVVEDDPNAGVPGAYLANDNGHFVFEAEDLYNGESQWALKETADLPEGHEAPSGGFYLEGIANDFATPNGSDVLTAQFAPEEDGFIRINLVTSRNPGDNATEHNDSWVGIQLNGVTIPALDQDGVELEPKGELGLYKAFSSGGDGDTFDNIANKNVDNVGKAIVVPVTGGEVYDFLLGNRSSGHEVDKVVLEFLTDGDVNPNNSASFHDSQPLSEQVPVIPVGEAVLTINDNSDNIEVSNFGNGSFVITNTGTKDITSIEIDVSDAILPDAVFDPLGDAGDTTAKALTLLGGSDGGTGLVVPAGGFGAGAVGITYLDGGGAAGFERIRLEFTDFNAGETISFGVDMDPNSIAGAQKATLDSGAGLTGAGGDNIWDVGGVSGAELANSTFTVTYADDTSSVGELIGQGTGQQSGGTAVSSQQSENLSVVLSVNGLAEGDEGIYGPGGPLVTIQGEAGETARIVLAKGFIAPFENNFADTDPFKAQLDAQLATLAASGFPANNVVEFQYVDITLDGTVQDVTGLFDFLDVNAFDLSEIGLEESELPLGFSAAIVDPVSGEAKGSVTDPIHVVFSTNQPPAITDPGVQTVDEGGAFSLQIVADDAEGDVPLTYALEVLDDQGAPVLDAPFTIDPATGLITGDAPSVLEETTLTARVTVTDALGEASTLDVPITIGDVIDDADLSLTKTVSDATPAFGDTITFTLTVTNDGPDAATGVQVSDLLPSGFEFSSATPGVGTYDETTGLWDIGGIASGDSITLTIDAVVLEESAPTPDAVIYRIDVGADSATIIGEDDSIDDSDPDFPNDVPNASLNGNASTPPGSKQFAPGVTLTGGQEFGSANDTLFIGGVETPIDLSLLPEDTVLTEKMFLTERFGVPIRTNTEIFPEQPSMEWDFLVDNGDYEVRLYFAEVFIGIDGRNPTGGGDPDNARQFDVEIEGALVLDDYSIFADVGAATAVLKSFDTTVTDGNLDIDLTTVVDNAKISAIEIVQKGTAGTVDYVNFAEVLASNTADPDSTPGDGAQGQDDDATVTVTPTELGENLVTIALVTDAAEPDVEGQFVVTLEEAAATDTVVTFTVTGTATADVDYTALTGQVIIPAGDLSAPIDVLPIDDLDFEDPETVIVTLDGATGDVNVGIGVQSEATMTLTSDELPPIIGSALIEITPGEGLGASTFGGTEAFQIVNTGVEGDADIASISFDLSTGILPDMVFDPVGAGGDDTAQVFSPDAIEAAEVGLVAFADNAVDPFSAPRNGGFDVLTIDFTDFNPGETFSFGVDVDPNSIQGVPNAGFAGAVSGYELIGSTVTITFTDGTTDQVAVSSLYDDGSLGGAQSLGQSQLSTAVQFAAPTIELLDGGLDENSLPGDQQSVPIGATTQIVRVTGDVGANVSLLQMDARLFIAQGGQPFDVSAEELPFYANEAMSGKTLYDAVIGEEGFVDIEVALITTPGETDTPDGGLNHFVAVLSDQPYTPDIPVSQTSNTLVIRQAETVDVTIAPVVDAAEPATNGSFLVSLAAVAAVDTVVTYEVGLASTATADVDYVALTGTVTILAGELSAPIDVTVIDDIEIEVDETVEVTLTGVTEGDGLAVIGASSTATVTIVSDDVNGAPVPAAEGNAASGLEDAIAVTGTLPAATDDRTLVENLTYALADPEAAPDGLLLGPDGLFSFIPPADFAGEVTFDYVVEDDEGGVSAPQTFTITVDPVNDAPEVTVGDDLVIEPDAGPQSFAGFAVGTPGGGADEAAQIVSFDVEVDDPSLFEVAPSIDDAGVLTFTAASGADGTATITVTPTDDGGVENGGIDTGAPQTFAITILPPENTAPEITVADSFDFVEGSAAAVFAATAVDGEGDDLTFEISGEDAALFSLDPETGDVTFNTPPNFTDGGDNTLNLTLSVSDSEFSVSKDIAINLLKDSDDDLIHDGIDNATFVFNPDQRDTDGDLYGNVIDADFDQNGTVGLTDLGFFSDAFGAQNLDDALDIFANADLDGDGNVGLSDLGIFAGLFGQPLGASGLAENENIL